MFENLDMELVREIATLIVAGSFVISQTIVGLRARGIVADGTADRWNMALSSAVATVVFVLTQFLGQPFEVADIEDFATQLSPLVVHIIALAVGSKLWWEIRKFLGRPDFPKAARSTPPAR